MTPLHLILCFLCALCIMDLHGDNQLIKRALLQSTTSDSFCDCYSVSLTNVASNTNNKREMCYTYSIQHNTSLDICKDSEATNILLGICDHERPKFKPKKLQKSVISIHPHYYNAVSYKPPRNKLTLKIENEAHVLHDEQFTLCMRKVNTLGITSNNVQYTLYDGHIITCSYQPNQIGLPCRSNQEPPNTAPIPSHGSKNKKANIAQQNANNNDDNDDPHDTPCETPPSPPNRGYSGRTNPMETPTKSPSKSPTAAPTSEPTVAPSIEPTEAPTTAPTPEPTESPTASPTAEPTTAAPTKHPSIIPSVYPTVSPTDNPSRKPTISPTIEPTTNPTVHPTAPTLQPTLSPTSTPTQGPSSQPPSTASPSAAPTTPSADICITMDQSCGFTDSQCDIYLDWIAEFIIRLNDGFYPRLCLLGVSHGVQVFLDLTERKSVIQMVEILRQQNCGNTTTNLLNAMEFAQSKLDAVHPRSDIRSMVIFSSCSSTDVRGRHNEHDICARFKPNPLLQTEVDFYVINIQSTDGYRAGRSDVNPNTYLQCLVDDDTDRAVSITTNNSANASQIIGGISDQIMKTKTDDMNHIVHAAGAHAIHIVNVLRDRHQHSVKAYGVTAFSDSTRRMIEWVFIITVICIVLNALCCTVCALRQSGALDPCFGDVDKGKSMYDEDGYYIGDELCEMEDASELADISDSSDATHIVDNEDVNLSLDSEDRMLNMGGYMDSFVSDEDDIDTPPIPASVESLIPLEHVVDDIKLKQYLKVKQSQQFQNVINVNHMNLNVKPKLYHQ